MSFFAENWILILVAFSSGAMLVWPLVQRSGGGSKAVGTAEAVRLINRERGVLVDVAEPAEFAEAHARGARNVPLGQLEGSKDLPSNKALPVILMCPSGARAGRAATLLRKAGYERAVAVSGGTRAWNEAALPIARGDEDAKDARSADKGEKGDKSGGGDKSKGAAKEGRSGKRGKAARAEAREGREAQAAGATGAAAVLAEPAAGPAPEAGAPPFADQAAAAPADPAQAPVEAPGRS